MENTYIDKLANLNFKIIDLTQTFSVVRIVALIGEIGRAHV